MRWGMGCVAVWATVLIAQIKNKKPIKKQMGFLICNMMGALHNWIQPGRATHAAGVAVHRLYNRRITLAAKYIMRQ